MHTVESAVLSGYICPVCGFAMAKPATDFNICPSCGTEFGNDDLEWTIGQLRQAWLDGGAKWWSQSTASPDGWDPVQQVLRVIPISPIGEPIAMNPQHYFSLTAGEWNSWDTTGSENTVNKCRT